MSYAFEVDKGDVVADGVRERVDAEVEEALGALEAAGEVVFHVDDLVGGRDNVVGGGEVEGRLGLLLVGRGKDSGGNGRESENGGLHFGKRWVEKEWNVGERES